MMAEDQTAEKKLRGSGGYAIARVTDPEQKKANLGGPELFLAGIGRMDEDRFVKYFCNKCEKEYLVICIGDVKDRDIEKMKKGFILPQEKKEGELAKGKPARIKSATITKKDTGRTYLAIILEEGQKRQIRRMFQFLGFTVQYLKRIRIGTVELGTLPKGKTRALNSKEISSLSGKS